MTRMREESGFSLIEVLVAVALFAVLSVGFYQVLFATTRHSDTSNSIARVSEEARLTFNRMVRDTREGDGISSASPNGYNVKVDFNSDGSYENPNAAGDYEDLTFSYIASDETIELNGEVLARGIQRVPGKDMFSYSSNFLEFDWNADGVTSWQELDQAAAHGVTGVGDSSGALSAGEYPFISSVSYAFRVKQDDRTAEFYGEAQIRNKR
jgi:prepilin-type N-terminal cleavage/methylation domain-containing protein